MKVIYLTAVYILVNQRGTIRDDGTSFHIVDKLEHYIMQEH